MAAIGSVVIEKKTPTRNEFIGLFVIVSGVIIAVYEGSDSKASIMGIALCILGKGWELKGFIVRGFVSSLQQRNPIYIMYHQSACKKTWKYTISV